MSFVKIHYKRIFILRTQGHCCTTYRIDLLLVSMYGTKILFTPRNHPKLNKNWKQKETWLRQASWVPNFVIIAYISSRQETNGRVISKITSSEHLIKQEMIAMFIYLIHSSIITKREFASSKILKLLMRFALQKYLSTLIFLQPTAEVLFSFLLFHVCGLFWTSFIFKIIVFFF